MKTALISGKVLILSILESRDLVITGVLAAAVWYLMGAENRYLVRLYQSQVEKATQELPDEAWLTADKRKAYCYVGQIDKFTRADLEKSESRDEEGIKNRRFGVSLNSNSLAAGAGSRSARPGLLPCSHCWCSSFG